MSQTEPGYFCSFSCKTVTMLTEEAADKYRPMSAFRKIPLCESVTMKARHNETKDLDLKRKVKNSRS